MFNFYVNTFVKFGCGGRNSLTEILDKEKWERLGIIIDHNLQNLPPVLDLVNNLRTRSDFVIIGYCPISEPTYDHLEKVRKEICDDSLQAIIGIGGGSALDMAKAMAVLVHNKKPAIAYRGFNKMTEPVLPIIAIPTTAGTGSEVTPNASFIDLVEKRKMGINGEAVRPRYALLDPELTLSCPKAPTISAAVDSLVHAVEAYVAKKTNPMARLFAQEGLSRVYRALPQVMEDPGNIEQRQEVMYGAFLSGLALMHSGTGPAAAMSYPLGVHYGVPHGLGGAIFLPRVVEHNIRHGYWEYADLAGALGSSDPAQHQEVRAQKFLEKLRSLWVQLEIPKDLNFCGFDQSARSKDAFMRETLELKGALDQNPVPFGDLEIAATLASFSRNS